MSKVSPRDRAATLDHLIERIRHRPRSEHHRLPSSRGGNNGHANTIYINEQMHFDWHTITRNQTGQEIASQWSEWWWNGHIFVGRGKVLCTGVAPGTIADPKLRGGYHLKEPTKRMLRAWHDLFGGRTSPEIVLAFANQYFVHPCSPLEIG